MDSTASEFDPAICPDGRWLAYASNESGRQEVYVVSLSDARSKYQATTEGGRHPLWTRGGSELFYLDADNAVAAVPVTRGETLAFGRPETLFTHAAPKSGAAAPTRCSSTSPPTASRIVVLEPEGDGSATLTVVTDWLAELGGEASR